MKILISILQLEACNGLRGTGAERWTMMAPLALLDVPSATQCTRDVNGVNAFSSSSCALFHYHFSHLRIANSNLAFAENHRPRHLPQTAHACAQDRHVCRCVECRMEHAQAAIAALHESAVLHVGHGADDDRERRLAELHGRHIVDVEHALSLPRRTRRLH